jgi:hypothetical protein
MFMRACKFKVRKEWVRKSQKISSTNRKSANCHIFGRFPFPVLLWHLLVCLIRKSKPNQAKPCQTKTTKPKDHHWQLFTLTTECAKRGGGGRGMMMEKPANGLLLPLTLIISLLIC